MATSVSFSSGWPLPLSSATKPNHGSSPLPKLCPKLSIIRPTLSLSSLNKLRYPLPPKASLTLPATPRKPFHLRIYCLSKFPIDSAEFVVETGTSVKFPREVDVPGCPEYLVLLGTGFREKVFAIIGVKVYAAGFYAKSSIEDFLDAWKGKSAAAVLEDSSLFKSVYQAPLDKSLAIVLVRDVDGKTFWNALDDVISLRIEQPTAVDESALSTFQSTFQGRDLKQGTSIFLTWTQHSHMLVSISSDGSPSKVDAKIESWNVTLALFDAFFGDSPVSPTLKASVADGLSKLFN